MNKLFEEHFEAEKVAGSATYKQSETVWRCFVLQGQFVYLEKKIQCSF